jgi:hypothetical protein
MFIISFLPFLLLLLWGGNPSGWWWIAAILAVPLVATFLFYAARPFATAVPKHSRTVGDTAKTVLGLNHAILVRGLGPSSPTELRKALQYVVIDITGAEPCWLEGNRKLLDLVDTTLLREQI